VIDPPFRQRRRAALPESLAREAPLDRAAPRLLIVMAGLVPAIHVFGTIEPEDADVRYRRGHEGEVAMPHRHFEPYRA
jgi:hypothetical protein